MARARDPDRSREAILAAARALFAAKGLHGVSMRDIALAAGRAQGLIHHYFGSKDELWRTVKLELGKEFAGVLAPFLSRAVVDSTFVREWVRNYFGFLSARPELCRMMLWMQLEGDAEPWEVSLELHERSRELIRKSQRAGTVRRGLEPGHLIHTLTAAIVFWITDKPAVCRRNGLDPDDPAVDRRFLEDLTELFRSSLLPTTRPRAPRP